MSNALFAMGQAASAGTLTAGAWDLGYADTIPNPWSLTNVYYTGSSFSVAAQFTFPIGLSFKPDGTKMYVLGNSTKTLSEYDLSTAWDVTTAVYSQNFSVSAQITAPFNMYFKPDGTAVYIVDFDSLAKDVNQYSLSTAWDVSTMSYVQNKSLSAQDAEPNGVSFKPDGTKMYITGDTNNSIYEYSLSTAWDISTASYSSTFSLATQDSTPMQPVFNEDGTKFFTIGDINNRINEYSLSTAWSISTATFVQYFLITSQETTPRSLFFKPDGSEFFMVGSFNDTVYHYKTYKAFSVTAQETNPFGLSFKPDGTKMYVLGRFGLDVNEYDLSTAWDVTTASYLQNFSVGTQETAPNGVTFKPDGTKMYVIGQTGDDVNTYTLSTPWSVASATYSNIFSVATQETTPYDVTFSTDGTKMYVIGQSGVDVNQYTLSTAWTPTSATYVQTFSISAKETSPTSVRFKSDGTKMFIMGYASDSVHEYSLSTAWDVSTATFTQSFSVAIFTAAPYGLDFKPDGTMMFITTDNDFVIPFKLLNN